MVLDRTLLYPNTDHLLTNKLFGSLDQSLTLETSGIGRSEKSPLHSFSPKLSKN